jgi:hypothetical protein
MLGTTLWDGSASARVEKRADSIIKADDYEKNFVLIVNLKCDSPGHNEGSVSGNSEGATGGSAPVVAG